MSLFSGIKGVLTAPLGLLGIGGSGGGGSLVDQAAQQIRAALDADEKKIKDLNAQIVAAKAGETSANASAAAQKPNGNGWIYGAAAIIVALLLWLILKGKKGK